MKLHQPTPVTTPDPASPPALLGALPARAPDADPQVIETLRRLIVGLQSKSSALAESQREARETFKLCDRYIRSYRGIYDPTVSAERNISRASCNPSQGKTQFSRDHEAFLAASSESEQLSKDVDDLTRELREFLKIEGGKHDAKILNAYAATVSQFTEYLLPVCVDEKEAKSVARGLTIPTRLHRQLNSWRHHNDALIAARDFLVALESSLDRTEAA